MLENTDQKKLRVGTLFTQFVFCKRNKSLPNKCPFLKFFWSVFPRGPTEYGTEYEDLFCKSPYSVRMRENRNKRISKYGHFLHSECPNMDTFYTVNVCLLKQF